MTELERTQRAIGAAMAYLRNKKDPDAVGTLEYIKAVLNPAPEYEEIEEIVGWVNVYQNGHGGFTALGIFSSEDTANYNAEPCRISCQPIKVTVQREKKVPVERSVSVGVKIRFDGVISENAYGHPVQPFKLIPETHGKVVTLTATWTEEPTT